MSNENIKKNELSIQNPEIDGEREIDLAQLFGFYMSRLPLLIIALIVGALIAGAYTYFMVPDKYTATSKMYMVSASSDAVVNLSDLNLGSSLSNDYVELMKSRPVIEDVIDKLELPYTYEQTLGMISLGVVTNTRIVQISVESKSPREAMNIANQVARTAKVQLPKVMEAPSPTIVEDAVLPVRRSSPSLSRNVIIGAMVLLVLVIGVLTVMYMQDDTIKSSEDMEKKLGIMPLATIPEGVIEGIVKEDDKEDNRKSLRRRGKTKKGGKA
jgi:capsular polysaccharide biosynthesis protein